jgi:hypothetical protein
MARWGASGSLRTHADDGQAGAVGQFRTTEEVLEQSRAAGSGGDGGKGTGQGEFATVHRSGLVDGHNLKIEWRFGDNVNERMPGLATELVKLDAR